MPAVLFYTLQRILDEGDNSCPVGSTSILPAWTKMKLSDFPHALGNRVFLKAVPLWQDTVVWNTGTCVCGLRNGCCSTCRSAPSSTVVVSVCCASRQQDFLRVLWSQCHRAFLKCIHFSKIFIAIGFLWAITGSSQGSVSLLLCLLAWYKPRWYCLQASPGCVWGYFSCRN